MQTICNFSLRMYLRQTSSVPQHCDGILRMKHPGAGGRKAQSNPAQINAALL